ncbi:alpha-L-arabinofuranosidase C-terminal domain-containing protein [Flavobacterium gilvum]|uniref:non-reducing end alpha-L-arabinofuranosidase n=1 Tax=Flavobacterium gilvum TaxID=1492737 RepID=A0AAC9I3P6_9FLAO|nr:alpha-L-arabinofuranosidase C-terminal domain-containing protein [Flavobacterium gilvum]AOW08962.1 alpha-L-arabinofuranosidase [Flavobacterium gilvum]KFC57966.1 alpha-L-arabinofuranosidase [Flavobacterium gilvum]
MNTFFKFQKQKKYFLGLLIVCFTAVSAFAKNPTEAYIFSYSNGKTFDGLHFAWSTDKINWHPIGPEYHYIHSDYGAWGSQKRMVAPILFPGADGLWHCLWSLNEKDGTFAHASSKDLLYWGRQSYPIVMNDNNCLNLEVAYNKEKDEYTISWLSNLQSETIAFCTTTKDFKKFSETKNIPLSEHKNTRENVIISGKSETGSINKVAWSVVEGLIKTQQTSVYRNQLWSETTKTDNERFTDLKPVEAKFTVDASKSKKISNSLIGIFFEDINYAADGGLYAELIQNRDFEYIIADTKGRDKTWNSTKAWSLKGETSKFVIDSINPIHPNNKHYAKLTINQTGTALVNEGFDGIPVKAGEKYDFSVFARSTKGKPGKLLIRFTGKNGEIYGETAIPTAGKDWKKYNTIITSKTTIADANLEIVPQMTGTLDLDLISLFPQKTFKGRKNGLRADLAQTLADLKPKFIRFPGGCVAHGDGLDNIYKWKNTIGPLESRKPMRNLWRYHQTVGLGYFEYFQFCEDIGAVPLPVIAAGVPCQNSSTGGAGQQCGIPMSEMKEYVQDILDLVEYANGDITTKWGKKRAEAGHPKPFNLKYIGIGNEDLITDIFEERFTMIFKAIKEKYPEITVIGTVGPTFEGTDYQEGWDIATKLNVPMVDEHYYQPPGWFIYNQDYYDSYDRSKPKVYLGEYAAHLPGKPNNIETALSEALYLTSIERNGDVVSMSSYAPLLAKDKHTQWNPNLIYFNNTEVRPTVGYEVQKLYGQNSGDQYIPTETALSNNQENVKNRIAVSIVRDSKTDDLIVKLVNLLPVVVKSSFDLKNYGLENKEALKTVLKGDPNDKNAKPTTSICSVSELTNTELPAYSFTVYRIKAKKK